GASRPWAPYATGLHGREEELDRIETALGRERLVTLTGAGGSGKTRLAVEVAARRARSGRLVVYLPLASTQAPVRLDGVLAGVLGLRVEPGAVAVDACRERLRTGGKLLVVDNCEHVLDDTRDLLHALVM